MTTENSDKDVAELETGKPVEDSVSASADEKSADISNTDSTDKEGGTFGNADKPDENSADKDIQTKVKRVGLAALILSMGILCSRLLGFVREAVIAYQAGAGEATDAYNAAFMLPDIMNYFLAGGTFSITFIPLFAGYIAKNEPKKAERLFSLIATTMGTFMLIGTALCWIFATPLSELMFSGFNADQISRTVEMTRVVLPGQIFHYIGGLMMAVLMARGQFIPSALAPLVYNLSIIIFGVVLGGDVMGMKGFAIGALVGAFAGPFLIPFIFLKKKIRYQPIFGFKDADFKKYLLLTLPLLLGASLTTVDEWIGRIIGSSMEAGSISWLNYARRLVLVPIAIVGQAAGQAALPYLSQLSAKGEYGEVASTLHKTLKNVILLSMIMIGFFVVLAEPMVSLIYERGKFSGGDTATTAMILRILAISIVFWTVQMVSVRAFYAAKNTLTPVILMTSATALSIPIYYLLSQQYGVAGLAYGSCIGMGLQCSSIVVFYHRQNEHFKPYYLLKYLGIGAFFGALAGGGSYLGLYIAGLVHIDSHFWQVFWTLGVAGTIGLIFAAVAARFIIPEEFKAFSSKIRRKVLRR